MKYPRKKKKKKQEQSPLERSSFLAILPSPRASQPAVLCESSHRAESLFRARKRKHPDWPFAASNAGRESSPVTEKSSARPFLCRVDYAIDEQQLGRPPLRPASRLRETATSAASRHDTNIN